MSGLVFEAVTVRYGRGRSELVAVDDVTLDVPPGSIVGLVGESGSGKSTLARTAVGLAPISSGRVTLDGREITDLNERGRPRPVQMVFQDPYSSLNPRMTIGACIAEAMIAEPRRAERDAEVARLMELVGMDPRRAQDRPAGLSGGQRQRVALARALAARPQVVLADEITSALDVSVQGAVLNLLRDVQRELGLSVLFISHNLAVVRYISDVVAVMQHGRVVEHGAAEEVLTQPRHDYTRLLLDSVPEAPQTG